MASHGMHPPLPVQKASFAIATPRAREGAFVPEPIEPNITGGSPDPGRRRRVHHSTAPDFLYKDMQPMVMSSEALTETAMAKAFGRSALSCPANSPAQTDVGIDQADLDRLKSLNINDILRHFSGEAELPPLAPDTARARAQTSAAGMTGSLHWPPL